jgi:murein DD-endopeptidase
MLAAMHALFVALFVCLVAGGSLAQAPAASGLRQSFDVQNPVPPTPFGIAGRTQLVYELHLSNFSADELELTRLEVVDAGAPRSVLGDYRGDALSSRIGRPGASKDAQQKRSLAPGMRVVLFLWLELGSAGVVPRMLSHRIEYAVVRPGDAPRVQAAVDGIAVAVDAQPPVVLDPPLRGGLWVPIYAEAWERGHRRVTFAVDGRVRIPARHAIDWVQADDKGKSTRGDPALVANAIGYGADVLAVADGVVASVRDAIAESASIAEGMAQRRTLDEASGNYVVLDLGQSRYAVYEHLKPGSVRVKLGERVRSGQVIAALGFTGDATGPHLHFHVADANATLAAEGRPFVFRRFDVVGSYDSIDSFAKELPWSAAAPAGPRRMEMPAALSVVRFGSE